MKKIITFFTGTIIFVVLPLITWGIVDYVGYFSNKERLVYSISMILMSILVVIVIPNQGKSVGEGEKMMKRHKISLRALQIIPLCIILVSPIFDRNQLFPFGQYERIRIVGIIGVIIGFIIMNWSAYTLGKQFSTDVTIQKNHEVISTGPYKRIRHPRYLGTIIFFLGIAGVFNALFSVALIVILCGFLVRRIYDEEKIMKIEFQKVWDTYTQKTWKLLPYIW